MIPVILLTGFLGSGKTTLLQRLLRHPSMEGTAVLVNEFGEVGLDHHLLDQIDENVVLLKSGCICCTVRGEVADALANLHSMRARGEISFDRVVIETTGLADPYPVLQTLTAHPVLRSHFCNGGVLTTVDTVNADIQVTHRAEAVRQISAADRIVLTKTDLATPEQETALRKRLLHVNPAANFITSFASAETILDGFGPLSFFTTAKAESHDHICGPACNHDAPSQVTQLTDQHRHHDETLGVTSFSLEVEGDIDWTMFGTWLTLLLHKYGDRIFRVKGILAIEGEALPIAIHGVQHLVHAPTHMDHWPKGMDQSGSKSSRLIFILEDIDPEKIRRSFRAFMNVDAVRAAA
ncbi:G3E family GTPase [Pacificibacter maritimus]|uniref:G3E family GTPase n=1 Tax=Pacificibacter maritimus TaxID=762213 RepID=A0A3N4V253_9RHOB|nr:GTP-binding protein [Pacificibacter maritimus]RPE66994.1 G3E family GTPase [Pacificibacter maritimus]